MMKNLYVDLFLFVIFIISIIITFVVLNRFYPTTIDKRLAQLASKNSVPSELGDFKTTMVDASLGWVNPFAGKVMSESKWLNSSLRTRFNNAGLHSYSSIFFYFSSKTFAAIALPILILLVCITFKLTGNWSFLGSIMFLSSVIGYFMPNAILSHLIAKRQQDLFLTFPDALDLLRVCVEAGLGLDAAIERVGREMKIESKALSQEFSLLGLELRVGSTRADALKNLALRIGLDDIASLVTMLVQADKFGTSMADSLKIYATSLRDKRRNITEEAAARLPVKILLPLIFCVFPALLSVLLGPAAINIYQVLGARVGAN